MVQVGVCTLLMMLNKSAIFTVIPRQQTTCIEQIFMLKLTNYRSSSEKAIIFIFNAKAGNALATSSTFLPEVFKPQTDK